MAPLSAWNSTRSRATTSSATRRNIRSSRSAATRFARGPVFGRDGTYVSVLTHDAPPPHRPDAAHPRYLPAADPRPRRVLRGERRPALVARRRLVERWPAAARHAGPGGAADRLHRHRRRLEELLRRAQLDRLQTRRRPPLDALRRGRLGFTGPHQ